jgi:hypothetical protein
MFFLMRYQTVVATRREINLARQFCRVSLVHRMETNVARQPFEVIRLLPAFIPRWSGVGQSESDRQRRRRLFSTCDKLFGRHAHAQTFALGQQAQAFWM